MDYFASLLRNLNKTILFLPICFAVISVTMIGSIYYTDSFIFTSDMKIQIAAFVLGFIAIFFILFIDYDLLQRYEMILYIGSILFLLTVYIPGLGVEEYGSPRWINLGITTLQPAELVKISFTAIFANYLCRHHEELATFTGLVKAGIYIAPFILIVVTLPDLGNTLVFVVMAAAMIFIAGVDGGLYGRIFALAIACMPIAYRFMPQYQRNRILAFLNPQDLSITTNYQVWHSKVSIGSGGLFGSGLFQGTYKELQYLPVPKSDFIFAIIIEELGLLGGLVLIGLYCILLFNISKVAKNSKDLYGTLMVTGILAMFFFQIFENIGMTMGMMPITGITLPFVSYGGTSIVTNMIALGIVLNVGMRSKLINFKN